MGVVGKLRGRLDVLILAVVADPPVPLHAVSLAQGPRVEIQIGEEVVQSLAFRCHRGLQWVSPKIVADLLGPRQTSLAGQRPPPPLTPGSASTRPRQQRPGSPLATNPQATKALLPTRTIAYPPSTPHTRYRTGRPMCSAPSNSTHAIQLIFRRLTPADYYNINKPQGSHTTGGGQSYIDIPTGFVSLDDWRTFFDGLKAKNTPSGPLWTVKIRSPGRLSSQTVEIGQRRTSTVNIRRQKLYSQRSNRIAAWHPTNGFPKPPNDVTSAEDARIKSQTKGLIVYLMRSDSGTYWAGWTTTHAIKAIVATDPRFSRATQYPAGSIILNPPVPIDVNDRSTPFLLGHSPSAAGQSTQAEPPIQDTPDFLEGDFASPEAQHHYRYASTYRRNQRVASQLKRLYGKCQITGDRYVFPKGNAEPYLEAHHLVPLGEGGSDRPANLVIVSAHVHRMLHYAKVDGIDLEKIHNNQLRITINDQFHTITWHPKHTAIIIAKPAATRPS